MSHGELCFFLITHFVHERYRRPAMCTSVSFSLWYQNKLSWHWAWWGPGCQGDVPALLHHFWEPFDTVMSLLAFVGCEPYVKAACRYLPFTFIQWCFTLLLPFDPYLFTGYWRWACNSCHWGGTWQRKCNWIWVFPRSSKSKIRSLRTLDPVII